MKSILQIGLPNGVDFHVYANLTISELATVSILNKHFNTRISAYALEVFKQIHHRIETKKVKLLENHTDLISKEKHLWKIPWELLTPTPHQKTFASLQDVRAITAEEEKLNIATLFAVRFISKNALEKLEMPLFSDVKSIDNEYRIGLLGKLRPIENSYNVLVLFPDSTESYRFFIKKTIVDNKKEGDTFDFPIRSKEKIIYYKFHLGHEKLKSFNMLTL